MCISENATEEERAFCSVEMDELPRRDGSCHSVDSYIDINFIFLFYFSEDLIRFCFIVPTGPSPPESKVKNGRLGNILYSGHIDLAVHYTLLQWTIFVNEG
jgi:hypothetical protein